MSVAVLPSAPTLPRRRGVVIDFMRQQPLGAISFVVIAVMMFAGIFSRLVAPYDPLDIDFASIRAMPYVDAARAAGYSNSRIILRHMAPNVVAPYLIMFTAFIAQAILLEASLSFLGLGVTEPTPASGLMLSGNAADFYREAPWMILFPGAAISLAVFAFNLFGDSLRDYLDPRFKT